MHDIDRDEPRGVSILVVLDLGHRPLTIPGGPTGGVVFQSLLCWISVIGNQVKQGEGIDILFQSLLCWISVIGVSMPPPSRSRSCSFNPCCVGSRSSAAWDQYRPPVTNRFQSLLCWISVIGNRNGWSVNCR